MKFFSRWQPQLLSVLRIMSALVFLQHGTTKFFHFPPNPAAAGGTIPAMLSLIWFAGIIELVGGALLTVGLCTRIAAFICSGELAFVYFIGHAPRNFYPVLNGGDEAILLCFIFLYIVAAGGGPIALDAQMKRGKA